MSRWSARDWLPTRTYIRGSSQTWRRSGHATHAAFASSARAEELAGSPIGTILPVSYHPRLELIADPTLLTAPELFFNAGRLDRSVAVATEDYRRLAQPRIEPIIATSA